MSETANNNDNNQGQQRSRVSMNDMAKKVTKGNKVAGIIVAILMIILGILFLTNPLKTEAVAMYFAAAGFIIFGVFQIISFIKTPSEQKNGWALANGIIFTILGIMLVTSNIIELTATFAFLLGFMAMFNGIGQCTSYGALKKSGVEGSGLVLASGIINIIMSLFFLIAPFAAVWAIAYIIGIYLIVGGIALFAEAASGHQGKKV